MPSPVFFDATNNQLIGLQYPQGYKAVRVPTWHDHISVNGAIRRDFTKLERVYQFQIGWEDLTVSEFINVETVWEKLFVGLSVTYTDMDGAAWTAKYDASMMPLTWTLYTGSKTGVFTTLYTATLLFRGIGSAIPWP